jgi:hypothetical protein
MISSSGAGKEVCMVEYVLIIGLMGVVFILALWLQGTVLYSAYHLPPELAL